MEHEKRWDLSIAIVSALIGGFMGITTVMVSQFFISKSEDKLQKQAILNRRIELIDRTASIMYGLPGIAELAAYEIHMNTDTLAQNYLGRWVMIPRDVDVSKALGDARGEYFATLIQDQLYFGNNTRAFIDSINVWNTRYARAWWETPDSVYHRLIETMARYLHSNL